MNKILEKSIGDSREEIVVMTGANLNVEEVRDIARHNRRSILAPDAIKMMEKSTGLKHELIKTGQPIYGVTTGFGDSNKYQISPRKTEILQRNMVRYHLNGVGIIADVDVVRATMAIRANCLARGHSGIRPAVVNRILEHLDNNITPQIPEMGSVGASGDLVPLCYLAASLIGEGDVLCNGEVVDCKEVIEEKGWDRLELEAKEGLALINGTSFMSAFASLAVCDAYEISVVADICTAMASEALMGNKGHFHEFIHENKPHPGQIQSAENIRSMLSTSSLSRDYAAILENNQNLVGREFRTLNEPIQDKYSIRCAPHVIGVLNDTLTWVKRWVETEINSTNDNPLFDIGGEIVHNGGNFYGGHIAQAMDSLKVAVANIADLLDRQLELIVDEKFNNGLTPNLIPKVIVDDSEAGLHHGFKGMQLACSAITAEALKMTGPVSVFSRPTESYNQDKVSMGTISSRDARTIIKLVREVAAIHLLALCQALDLRGVELSSDHTRAVHNLIRKSVPFVDRDRRMDGDIAVVVDLIASGAIAAASRD